MVFHGFRKYWMSEQFKHLPNMPQKNYLSFNAGLMNLFYSQ
jgi:hypothetical protein